MLGFTLFSTACVLDDDWKQAGDKTRIQPRRCRGCRYGGTTAAGFIL